MKKIESLTKEQEISLPNFVDKWVGYASEPIDYKREEAEVKCVLEERHDTQVLPAGDYIVRRKVEYDHLLHTKKVVAD